jgi:hypothetical protein
MEFNGLQLERGKTSGVASAAKYIQFMHPETRVAGIANEFNDVPPHRGAAIFHAPARATVSATIPE